MRIKIIENFIFVLLGLIVVVLVYLQIIRGEHYYDQSVHNRIRVIPLEGPRGMMVDRRGTVLADSHLVYHVAVIGQDVQDQDALFNFLSGVLKKELKNQFLKKQKTPFTPVILAENIGRPTAIAIEENRFFYPGLVVQESYERTYPFGSQDAHALGYVGKIDADEAEALQNYGSAFSVVGKMGVEKTYDALLRGDSGGRQIEINSRGQEVRLLGLKNPGQGQDIQLTIDERIQEAASQLLDSRPGAVIVMDLSNGDILGIVSSPSFDPNAFYNYLHDPAAPLFNRAVAAAYPPGSVFKIPLALAAVELKKISPEQTFNCPGYYLLGRARFGCSHVHGPENLNQAIAHSCNVYFFHVGRMVTARVTAQYAKALGLGRATGVDLPFEAAGYVGGQLNSTVPHWYTGDTLNFSIGQGDTLTTPLQLTVMMAAVADDGIILRPRIVKAINHQDLPPVDLRKLPTVRLHEATWRLIQQGLRSVVTDETGTAHELNDLTGMTVFGKTGTAQAGMNKPNHAWWVGYARSPKSNLVFCVFLEHGGASSHAVDLARHLLLRLQQEGMI